MCVCVCVCVCVCTCVCMCAEISDGNKQTNRKQVPKSFCFCANICCLFLS